jgi:hypothetical protein
MMVETVAAMLVYVFCRGHEKFYTPTLSATDVKEKMQAFTRCLQDHTEHLHLLQNLTATFATRLKPKFWQNQHRTERSSRL